MSGHDDADVDDYGYDDDDPDDNHHYASSASPAVTVTAS